MSEQDNEEYSGADTYEDNNSVTAGPEKEENEEADIEEFVFDEEPVMPKWFKNKVVDVIALIGIIILIGTVFYFIKYMWPDIYEIMRNRKLERYYESKGDTLNAVLANNRVDESAAAVMGKVIYFEIFGSAGIILLLIFVFHYLLQVFAKKRQETRKKRKERKFNREKEKQRKEAKKKPKNNL